MRILLTGFKAFGGSQINPSEQVINELRRIHSSDPVLELAVLPVNTQKAPEMLESILELVHPDAVVCLGEASGRACISIERVALNLMDFRIPDNAGIQVTDQPIILGAPSAYFSSLPIRRLQEDLLSAGIPAELSLSAGTYLCNQVFFYLMHWLAQHQFTIPAGFIHVPSLPGQVAQRGGAGASMSLETTLNAVNRILSVLQE
jgi:pyroglutamyl-peptidase